MGLFDEFKKKAVIAGAGKAMRSTVKTGKNFGNKVKQGANTVKQNIQTDLAHRKETKQIQAEGQKVIQDAQLRLAVSQKLLSEEMSRFDSNVKQLEKLHRYAQFIAYLQQKGVAEEQTKSICSVATPASMPLNDKQNYFAKAISAGLASGLSTIGAVTAAGTASTGTALTALSGSAYYTAMLAALGGGSVAAGGLGMLGGIAVLGVTIAAPAFAIASYGANKKIKADYQQIVQWREDVIQYCSQVHDACYLNDLQRQKLRQLNQDMSAFMAEEPGLAE